VTSAGARQKLTIGVEEEFVLIDSHTGLPAARSDDVLDADARMHGDLPAPGPQSELLSSMVETATAVCTDLTQLRAELTAARGRLAEAAQKVGAHPLASGAAPMSAPVRQPGPTRHYREMAELYGRLTNEAEACGCHVHVGIPDRATAVAVLNHLRPWLPTLLALSANSPFHQGADTGYASWRTMALSRWPATQIPPYFESAESYDDTNTTLRNMGVLPTAALNAYWLARPSSHLPTVEIRVADVTPSIDETVLQAGLTRALVATALDAVAQGSPAPRTPDHEVHAALWTAARYGLSGPAVHPLTGEPTPARHVVRELVLLLRPALEASGDFDEVRGISEWVLEHGNGADRRRRGPGGVTTAPPPAP
jgi:carboxylate-amine ligase